MLGGESQGIPCTVARWAEREGDVVFAHEPRIVQTEPRVRPSQHRIGVLAREQPERSPALSVGQRARVVVAE